MAEHTSFHVGGPVDAWVNPRNREELIALMTGARERKIKYRVVGDGTNLLVDDRGMPGIAINLSEYFRQITLIKEKGRDISLYAEAGVRTKSLCRFCLQRGYQGMHFALGIPGTIGGAIQMNAGTGLGWMSDVLRYIEIVTPGGTTKKIFKDKLTAGYRRLSWEDMATAEDEYPSVILGGCFELTLGNIQDLRKQARTILKMRQQKQPIGEFSGGCFFKNPDSERPAGWLIDQSGLKGQKYGGAVVSKKHANFIINAGDASASDILGLMKTVQKTVFEKYQIMLEPEVQIVSEEKNTEK